MQATTPVYKAFDLLIRLNVDRLIWTALIAFGLVAGTYFASH